MNKYQNTNTQEIKSYKELKVDNPMVSLAPDGTDPLLDIWRVITPTPMPTYNQYVEKPVEIDPINFIQTWSLVPLSQEQIDLFITSAKDTKYSECEKYAESLSDAANSTPYVGYTTTSSKNKKRMAARINKSTNGRPKTDTEMDRDDALTDYCSSVYDSQDLCDDAVENMDDAQAIHNVDVSTAVTWPLWVSPV